MDTNKDDNCCEIVARVLIRCFFAGAIFLLIWFLLFLSAHDWIYGIHSRWFDITKQQFGMVHYFGMAMTKIFILLAFLMPYIFLRILLPKDVNRD